MESLVREQRLLKRQINIVKARIDDFVRKSPDSTLTNRLESELKELTKLKNEFENIQSRILVMIAPDDESKLEKEETDWIAHTDEVRVIYTSASGKIRDILDKFDKNRNNDSIMNSTVGFSADAIKVKLPKIQIPKFSGDMRCWPEFYNLFCNLIHNEMNLSNVQKLYYLKDAVQNEASAMIRDFEISDTNYVQAWDVLCSRYNNKRSIINTHLKDLFSLPKVSELELRKLLDNSDKTVRALKALGENTDDWDTILSYWISSRLDPKTKREWELSITDINKYPSYTKLKLFLRNRSILLDELKYSDDKNNKVTNSYRKPNIDGNSKGRTFLLTKVKCHFCQSHHFLEKCDRFVDMSVEDRYNFVKSNKLCMGCFSNKHLLNNCKYGTCKLCKNGKHHSLLHRTVTNVNKNPEPTSIIRNEDENIINSSLQCANRDDTIILPTAVVRIRTSNNKGCVTRILLDSASQVTLISEALVKRIRCKMIRKDVSLLGIGNNDVKSNYICTVRIQSRFDNFYIDIEAIIVPLIPYSLPTSFIPCLNESNARNLNLAECKLLSSNADILLGAEYYESIMLNETCVIKGLPTLRNTKFGWVVSGKINTSVNLSNLQCCHLTIEDQLKEFWSLEEIGECNEINDEHIECERHFEKTYLRTDEGRFMVRLPFKRETTLMGDSRGRALNCFYRFEKNRDSELRNAYIKFMLEYLELSHMELIQQSDQTPVYYLPHHGVIKESTTTSLRVVFNASAKSTSGVSLNDLLMIGPRLQPELFDILVRFRKHAIAIVADVEKMYRQVLVQESDRDYQRVLWRKSVNEPIQEYRLKTVTYGTTSASFLATKCLKILSESIKNECPLASRIVLEDFYMDDLMTGASSLNEAILVQGQVHSTLLSGGFPLQKYMSNNKEFLNLLDKRLLHGAESFRVSDKGVIPVLGLYWSVHNDTFAIKITMSPTPMKITKRFILSEISRIFDPLGFLAPITIRAKLMLQTLWKEQLDWDHCVSDKLASKFCVYRDELEGLREFSINRRYSIINEAHRDEIHGFCDASKNAYAAAVYLRRINDTGIVSSMLICAKTKVAPIKQQTIPRLELCGAVLLTKLIKRVSDNLNIPIERVFCYSDSTIVLGWLSKDPGSWQGFVSNRVAQIIDILPAHHWIHVVTSENPADSASRGIRVSNFLNNTLWLNGPPWLSASTYIPKIYNGFQTDELPERRKINYFRSVLVGLELNNRFSSYIKWIRVNATIIRFIKNCRLVRTNRHYGELSIDELDNSLIAILRDCQSRHFPNELQSLIDQKLIKPKGSITALSPFLDKDNLLRVGGRLEHSTLPYERRHPIILHAKDHFVELYIRHIHQKYFHVGPRSTKTFKSYIAFFVCFAVKAIHIELVTDMTTATFIAAFRRFVSRRGLPSVVYSDNGRNFVGFQNLLNSKEKSTYASQEWNPVETRTGIGTLGAINHVMARGEYVKGR